jgi:hypothetical protein
MNIITYPNPNPNWHRSNSNVVRKTIKRSIIFILACMDNTRLSISCSIIQYYTATRTTTMHVVMSHLLSTTASLDHTIPRPAFLSNPSNPS